MVGSYIGGLTLVTRGGATGPPAAPVGWAQRSPEGGATAATPPVARWGATAPLFFQGPR